MIWGVGHSTTAFYSVILCAMINFSLPNNVLCFSFVVVFYSMYSLHVIIKVVLRLDERGCHVMCNKKWKLKVIGIRPMAPVLNKAPLEGIWARNVKFFGKERNY